MVETSVGVPVSPAATRLRMTREKLIRRIQLGAIAGGQDESGRWYVDREALERAARGRSGVDAASEEPADDHRAVVGGER